MAELPILPLKTDALLADTGHLSAEEFGAYCRILFTMWRQGARLPADPAELAHIAGVSLRRWRSISEKVMRPITVIAGVATQKRLSSTWLEVQEVRRQRAEAAHKRWNNRSTTEAMQMHSNSNANQNQIKSLSSSSRPESAKSSEEVAEEKRKLVPSPFLVAKIVSENGRK